MNKNPNFARHLLQTAIASLLVGAASVAYAGPGSPISGTYFVTYSQVCVYGPWRPNATPAYFSMNTQNGINGMVQTPVGTLYQDAAVMTSRAYQTGSYLLKVNGRDGTTIVENGTFNNIPFNNYGTNPPAIADFGTFNGTGTFTGTDNQIALSSQNVTVNFDGVSQYSVSQNSNLRTDDSGQTLNAVPGAGAIRLQRNHATGLYRDQYCTGNSSGVRTSRQY